MSEEFMVNDKRLFNKDGQVNDSKNDSKETLADEQPRTQTFPEPDPHDSSGSGQAPANFASLLVGLATSAFIHLGETSDEEGQKSEPDLVAAQQAIDFLAVLQAKTKGNLEPEEESLLSTLLYDLRLKYVQAAGQKK